MAKRLTGEQLKPFHNFMKDYIRRYTSLDAARVDEIWAEDAHCIGTGPDEWYVTRKQLEAGIRRDFSELDSVQMEYDRLEAFAASDHACLSCQVKVAFVPRGEQKADHMPPLRFTLFLVMEQGGWKIQHIHASGALNSQPQGRSFPEAERTFPEGEGV
ncbi:MAG: nuclear transport factor 2 family protein [Endozoicomonas sp.]